MKSKVIALPLILVLLLLPFSTAAPEDLRKEIVKAAEVGAKYHTGGLTYVEAVTEINEIKENSNAILKREGLEKGDLEEVLGEPTSETSWVKIKDENNEVQLSDPVSEWEEIAFDGKIQLKSRVQPVISDEKISYELDFSFEFKEEKPLLDIKEEIKNIQDLAKTFSLDPTDLEAVNSLAERTVSVQDLFKEYAQQAHESCEELLEKIIGAENKISEQNIVVQTFGVHNDGNREINAVLERCDDCLNANWVNLRFTFEEADRPLRFIESSYISDFQFSEMDTNELKRTLIEYFGTFQTLADAGSYQAAYDVSTSMEKVSDAWDQKCNEGDLTQKQLCFADEKSFYLSLFQDTPISNSYSEQITFEQILVQEIEEGMGEMCENKIDDNSDGDIDCKDTLCTGQPCGVETVTVTKNNQTTNVTRELFCTAGICQPKTEQVQEVLSVCGNYICEEGEDSSCAQDCFTCPIYPPLDCSGEVIAKGADSNGCSLESVCIPKTDLCTSSSSCEQPLCGTAECIEGACQTTSIGECRQLKCVEAEKKAQRCSNGASITTEICSNGAWKATGSSCEVSISSPEIIVAEPTSSVCKVSESCAEGYYCKLGVCELGVLKSLPVQPVASTSTSSVFKGVTVTGDVVAITGEGITGTGVTGVVADPDISNTGVLTKAKDYQIERSTEAAQGSSLLTGIVTPSDNEETADEFALPVSSGPIETLRPATDNEKEVFVVRGTCSKNQRGEKSILTFSGGGDKFNTIIKLQERYEEDGTPTYTDWKLEKLLQERRAFETSFNPKFAKLLFEETLANSAENWESMSGKILYLHEQNVQNWVEIARMMDSLGIKELVEYHPISFEYNSNLGRLKYSEKTDSVFFSGMRSPTKILSPSIEIEVYPTEEFIKNELRKAMLDAEFPGSVESTAEREVENGLTGEEKMLIRNNPETMELITALSESYTDKNLDVQIMIKDGDDVIYNIYARVNAQDIIKAEPISAENTPSVDAKIEIPFDKVYTLMESSRRIAYSQDASWDKRFKFSKIISSTVDWITIKRQTSSLIGSIVVEGNNAEKVKTLFEKVFFRIGEDENAEKMPNIVVTDTSSTIWNEQGVKFEAK